MTDMTIRFEPTRKDVRAAARRLSVIVRYLFLVLWCIVAAFIGYAIHKSMQEGYGFAESFRYDGGVTLILLAIFFAFLIWLQPLLYARSIVLRPQEWNLTDERVKIQTPVGSTEIRWEAYIKYRETPKLFLLYPQRNLAHFIPKRILTTQQADELRSLITSHIKKA